MKFRVVGDYDGGITLECCDCHWSDYLGSDTSPEELVNAGKNHTEHLPRPKPIAGAQFRQMFNSVVISGSSGFRLAETST